MRRIFEWYADGVSPRKIAARLNAGHVPSPGARWKRVTRRKDGKWLASAIHGDVSRGSGMLNNARYVGRIAYGRRQFVKNPDTGVRVVRPGEEHIEFTDERLRIVPQELWDRVKARQARRSSVGALVRAGLRTRAGGAGRPGKYLFSGLLACDVCGGVSCSAIVRITVVARTANGAACSNTIGNVAALLCSEVILDGIRRTCADPFVIAEVERRVREVVPR